MKTARVLYQGQVLSAVESDGQLLMANGQRVSFDAVTWLPPFAPTPRPRTILALGLNYADHAKELAFKAPEEPLVFIKGAARHADRPPRPDASARGRATYMHYECELAVVVGKTGKHAMSNAMMLTISSPATPWPTTTPSATTWKTGTAPICA
jgi:5-oxopent-3-ene-1,2,5-tricarboxylate decarboxylase/2-hydroxyhepta-2,4-diene-1,7-dioate isomerase